jgi:phosphoenolpyruvate synthase/pyruvate phosphate dikinase
LTEVRRKDSGIRVGPKAAFLGELKFLFPNNVARGVVVPFGAYYDHYRRTRVALPPDLQDSGIATAGEPLPAFVERTYGAFFDEMIPAKKSERELSAWIQPRLEIMQYSIRTAPLSDELKAAIRDKLAAIGLLEKDRPESTVGCFVRSDTNVEDLEDFNGAGLNLTLFNLRSLADIYEGLKEVWASPFSYRSFSWRQTLIDEPLWVLPSVVILESVPSEKSGVLVTADIDQGDQGKMLIATSEGVGGAVDGTPAETVLWSPDGTELVTMFKSPWRRLLGPDGGSKIVPSTGKSYVLDDREIAELTKAGAQVRDRLEPARNGEGEPRPWDIEFGFSGGRLWLFQSRPFLGNDEVQNLPALAALDGDDADAGGSVSLEEKL